MTQTRSGGRETSAWTTTYTHNRVRAMREEPMVTLSKREIIIATVMLLIGITVGFASCPKRTGTILDNFNTYVSSFHYDENDQQIIKHAYVSKVGETYQCLLFNKDGPGASLIGVEYIVGKYKYDTFSDKEKKEWYPLEHEVKSGLLAFPRLGKLEADKFVHSMSEGYSKSVMLYNPAIGSFEHNRLYCITKDVKLSPELMKKRDVMCKVNTTEIREDRNLKFNPRPAANYSNYRGHK